jgi:hypothetical protein
MLLMATAGFATARHPHPVTIPFPVPPMLDRTWLRRLKFVPSHTFQDEAIESMGHISFVPAHRIAFFGVDLCARSGWDWFAVQRRPRCQRVHVIPPVHDFSVFDCDDGAEPVVIGHPGCENCAVHVIFEDCDTTVLRAVYDKSIGRMKLYGLAVSGKLTHQSGSPANGPRPAGKVVAEIKNHDLRDRVEEVFPVDEPGEPFQNNVEEGVEGIKNCVFGFGHGLGTLLLTRAELSIRVNSRKVRRHIELVFEQGSYSSPRSPRRAAARS